MPLHPRARRLRSTFHRAAATRARTAEHARLLWWDASAHRAARGRRSGVHHARHATSRRMRAAATSASRQRREHGSARASEASASRNQREHRPAHAAILLSLDVLALDVLALDAPHGTHDHTSSPFPFF